MTHKIILYVVGIIVALTLITPDTLIAKKEKKNKVRKVTIIWNSISDEFNIEVVPDNGEAKDELYELKSRDKILLEFAAEKDANLEISYKITGPDVVGKFKKGIPLFLEPESADKKGSEITTLGNMETTPPQIIKVAVTDDLLPGGTLAVTFKKTALITGKDGAKTVIKEIDGDGVTVTETNANAEKPKTKTSEKTFIFRVKDKTPWFFTSTGIVFTHENNQTLFFKKTSTVITIEKDGESQEYFQQVVGYKDRHRNFRPKQTLVQFIHLKVIEGVYFSLGVPINNKIFTEPFLGGSYYNKFKNVGYAITAGVHFHKEIVIDKDSGFDIGNVIDPTKLTVEEIPTNEPYKLRFFMGISFKL